MIMVDIYVPRLGKSYDFQLDEKASIEALIEEICEMVCQHEHLPANTYVRSMSLSCTQLEKTLPFSGTLDKFGVRNGYRLVLA